MLTRAELDELRAFRQVRAARRARSFVWRPRLAIGVAVASLSIVASIVGRELNPFTPASALLPVPDVRAEASNGSTRPQPCGVRAVGSAQPRRRASFSKRAGEAGGAKGYANANGRANGRQPLPWLRSQYAVDRMPSRGLQERTHPRSRRRLPVSRH